MRKVIIKSVYVGILLWFFLATISCEEDFTDIGSNVISNTKFSTNFFNIEITAENSILEKVKSDNITREPGQYLLGVYKSADYEKLEASMVSQIAISAGLTLLEADTIAKYETSTTSIITTIDTVFIKLPYQATLIESTATGPKYTLDSIVGDQTKAFTFNAYQTSTYLSRLNPADPSKLNSYFSNDVFDKKGDALNAVSNFEFKPSAHDTVMIIKRWASNKTLVTRDTVKYSASTSTVVPLPFAAIPLNEDKFKQLFLDKYGSSDFDSQDAFNDYFRGLILEASGSEGSLISFNFINLVAALRPSIEVYYTNTAINTQSGDTIKTFRKNNSFLLSGVRSAIYKMDEKTYPVNNEIKLQGTAGSEASIDLFGPDLDNNGIADKIEELRAKNWLINDASLSFYINQSSDTTAIPFRLYMYKTADNSSTSENLTQIKDSYSEPNFGGFLERDASGKAEKYTFRITDYISDILSGAETVSSILKLKVHNISDDPISTTLFTNYNWSPKVITLLNQDALNGDKRAILKISYSEKKN
ncbi:hypothetical protein BST83_17350 [Polaribacter filamentus]|uniref:DUF4270 domain-containing protein n=1 Tax=Polaribacter filamentus TaxID=53483 RepID=A0A2S7KKF7_9FLAO|nr:DUF4270 domain-containing protein [Polaribacter filamentus]PQB03095.1 hypothetical protein BST83_17350 [Polaribacter filamentus]